MNRARAEIDITVHCGVHGRVAVRLAEIAREHGVELSIIHQGQRVRCDSILEVLALALVRGTRVAVETRGKRAEEALAETRMLLSGEKAK